MTDALFTPDELEILLLGSTLNKPIKHQLLEQQLLEQQNDNAKIIMFNAKANKWEEYDRDTSNNR